MTSSDKLMAIEQPWGLRSAFSDAWISDIFTKETETITKALVQKSLSDTANDDVFSVSGGSENDAVLLKPRRGGVPPSGRVTKRKSRVSKCATTTFITADPANFRQMVQQVTGVKFGGFDGQMEVPIADVVKPEPQRYNRFYSGGGNLPTLDMSAFFLDVSASSLVAPPSTVVAGELESFCSFPTLESWKV